MSQDIYGTAALFLEQLLVCRVAGNLSNGLRFTISLTGLGEWNRGERWIRGGSGSKT